jgi:hypothetical protein
MLGVYCLSSTAPRFKYLLFTYCTQFTFSAPTWNPDIDEIDFQNAELNQLLALISTLLTPIRGRQEFLPEFSIDFKPSPDGDRTLLSPQSDGMWTGVGSLFLPISLLTSCLLGRG